MAPGPEDIVIDHEAGMAYVAATDRRALAGHAEVPADGRIGGLFRIDLTATPPDVEDITPNVLRTSRFHPQGLDLWVDADGGARHLFVTDRRHDYDADERSFDSCAIDNAVHIFRIEHDGTLVAEETVVDAGALVRLNDVAASSPTTFYATNDHGARSCLERHVRDLFGLNGGHLVHYDGSGFQRVADDLPFANGVAFDRLRGRVHVGASQSGEVVSLMPADGGFARWTHVVGSAPDNITLASDGDLLIAAHPDRWAFLRYRMGFEPIAPSQLLTIDPTRNTAVTEVLANDGAEFPAASVAAIYAPVTGTNQLLVGTVYDSQILICRGAP